MKNSLIQDRLQTVAMVCYSLEHLGHQMRAVSSSIGLSLRQKLWTEVWTSVGLYRIGTEPEARINEQIAKL